LRATAIHLHIGDPFFFPINVGVAWGGHLLARRPAACSHAAAKFESPGRGLIMNVVLWIIQVLLALLFLFAGGMKLILPIEEMTKQMPMPGLFLRFIGVCEVLGALGLILPGLLRIRPGLTPLAAAGLVIIMIGATVLTLPSGNVGSALMSLVAGILAAFVAFGRWRLVPSRG
jgi:uncharacterized membrane protein YphA (DoxX/SURF4 family)